MQQHRRHVSQFNLPLIAACAVIGLLAGIGRPAQAAIPKPPTAYTVVSGDTLARIAKNFGVSNNDLKQYNSLQTDLLIPGHVLLIPGTEGSYEKYTVQKGDTLYLIAVKNGISVAALNQANQLSGSTIYPGQVLTLPGTDLLALSKRPLKTVLAEQGLTNPTMQLVIDKSDHLLSLFAGNIWLKSYHTSFGDGGSGDKEIQGDHKTPEGYFYIVERSILQPADEFLGTRWFRLGYPNIEDAARGVQKQLIGNSEYQAITTAFKQKSTPPQQTRLGGGVGIHGGTQASFALDWTWGCIGLTNQDIEEFFPYLPVGTAVIIKK